MVAKEHGVVTQRTVALPLSLHFMRLRNQEMQKFVAFIDALMFLIANDKILIKTLL